MFKVDESGAHSEFIYSSEDWLTMLLTVGLQDDECIEGKGTRNNGE